MTALQVEYWKTKEQQRHNFATEAEEERHNKRDEDLKHEGNITSLMGNVAKSAPSVAKLVAGL